MHHFPDREGVSRAAQMKEMGITPAGPNGSHRITDIDHVNHANDPLSNPNTDVANYCRDANSLLPSQVSRHLNRTQITSRVLTRARGRDKHMAQEFEETSSLSPHIWKAIRTTLGRWVKKNPQPHLNLMQRMTTASPTRRPSVQGPSPHSTNIQRENQTPPCIGIHCSESKR